MTSQGAVRRDNPLALLARRDVVEQVAADLAHDEADAAHQVAAQLSGVAALDALAHAQQLDVLAARADQRVLQLRALHAAAWRTFDALRRLLAVVVELLARLTRPTLGADVVDDQAHTALDQPPPPTRRALTVATLTAAPPPPGGVRAAA